MRMLTGFLLPTSGTASVLGHDTVREADVVRQLIGYVPQERAIDRFLTGREHLELLGALYHLPKAEATKRIAELLKLVELEEAADRAAKTYSGGMKRKLDIACGLNPLALPWMQLAEEGAAYYAYDIYHSMVDFLQGWLALMHVQGSAQVCDVLQTSPPQQADVAFLLKAIPCLEQLDKTAGHRLLREIHAQNLVVSFPIHSLGGRSRGMLEHYEAHFRELIAGVQHWEMKRLIFDSELVFVVKK